MSYGSPPRVRISPLPEETITIEEWLAETSITAGTRRNRKVFLRTWTKANGKNPTSDQQAVEAAKELLKDIVEGKTTVYQTSKKRSAGAQPLARASTPQRTSSASMGNPFAARWGSSSFGSLGQA